MVLNRLINFTQTGDDEWTTPRFQILYSVGMYSVKEVYDENGTSSYRLIRDIDNGKLTDTETIIETKSRNDLAEVAEKDLLKLIKESNYGSARMKYFAETMVMFIELIDRILEYKVQRDQPLYDYIKLREKVTAFIRVKFCIGFFYRGFIASFMEMIKTKKKSNDILKSILFSLLLMVRREIKERLNENKYDDRQWIAILYDISDIERRIFKLRFGQ